MARSASSQPSRPIWLTLDEPGNKLPRRPAIATPVVANPRVTPAKLADLMKAEAPFSGEEDLGDGEKDQHQCEERLVRV